MPRLRSQVRIALELWPLSPMTWSGRIRRRPGPIRGTRIVSITAVNWVQSLVLPPVSANASGRPKPSHARWILLVSPPRDRPRAGPGPPFSGSGGVLVGADDGGVDRYQPVDVTARVGLRLRGLEHPLERAVRRPPAETGMETGPRSVPLGHVPPSDPSAELLHDPVEHHPVIQTRPP